MILTIPFLTTMTDIAIVIVTVFLVSIILAVVVGMLACQFCCEKDKDDPEVINSEGHKSIGLREVGSDGGFKYTPIRPMDTKPKEPRKIHDVEPDDSDVEKKTNEIINKKNPNETIVMNKNGNVKKVSINEAIKSDKDGKKKSESEDLIKGQKVIIAQGPKGTTSPSSPPTSPGQSSLTSPPSSKTSPSSSCKGESPGTASHITTDSAPEPTPISTRFENDAILVDDKTYDNQNS